MKVPTRKRQHGLQFNVTPLIDIVFLLIIFFLAASHFVRAESHEAIDLPEATQIENQEEESPGRLVITVTADQVLQIGGNVLSIQDVERMIQAGADAETQFEVRIRGDRNAPYKTIEPILLAAARAGVTKVKFSVLQAGQ